MLTLGVLSHSHSTQVMQTLGIKTQEQILGIKTQEQILGGKAGQVLDMHTGKGDSIGVRIGST